MQPMERAGFDRLVHNKVKAKIDAQAGQKDDKRKMVALVFPFFHLIIVLQILIAKLVFLVFAEFSRCVPVLQVL